MRLDIRPELFDAGNPVNVTKLITLVVEQRHDWHPDVPTAIAAETFARQHAGCLLEFIQQAVVEGANPLPPAAAVASIGPANLPESVHDLGLPAVIVVENRLADGAFLRRVATVFGDEPILRAIRETWLRFSNAGGNTQMAKMVAEECDDFRVFARVVALLDHDQQRPDEETESLRQADRIRADGRACVHVWEYRTVENYVPYRVWERHFPDRVDLVDTLRAMPREQRRYTKVRALLGKPSCLIPDDMDLRREDFADLGADIVGELGTLLAKIKQIL